MEELDAAEQIIRSVSKELPQTDAGSSNIPGFIATGWVRRATDTALGSIALRRCGLEHVTEPLNRFVLELTAHIAWLAQVDDLELALLAIEDDRIRNLGNRFESFKRSSDEMGELLAEGVESTKDNRATVASHVTPEEMPLYKDYQQQFKNFEQLVQTLDTPIIYSAYRVTSANAHANLDVSLEESSRLGNGPLQLTNTTMGLRVLVTLACVAATELGKLQTIGDDLKSALSSASGWLGDHAS
jgi:hypothetical protein